MAAGTGLIAVAVMVYACKAPTVQPPAALPPPAPITITTSYQGAQVVSEVNQAKELAYNSTIILKSLAAFGNDVIVSDPTITLTAAVPCPDYGSYTYTGSVDGSGNYHLTLTFSICRANGLQFDGASTYQGTPANALVALSSIRVVRFNNANYSAITGTLSLGGLSFSMNSFTNGTDESYDIRVSSGTYAAFDYVMLGQFSLQMIGLNVSYVSSTDPATFNKTSSLLVNGLIRESWSGGFLLLTYSGFSVSKNEYYSAGPPAGYSASDTIISGTVTISLTPGSYGPSGIVSIATPTTPIHHDYSTGMTTAGEITVTGTGTATATFNAGGDIDVAVSGGTPISFNREYFVNNMVNIFGMEQTLPQLQGPTGIAPTANAAGSSWPATMTVTALSLGPDLGCFTDVHVNYYNPTDMLVPTETTYVDYHVHESCTSPAGIPFMQMIDIDHNGSCDFGLDIAAAQTDITSGGVEHFTATTVPEGYYVVSINNWGCPTTISNMASIIVGDYMFGTYNCTYTTASADGTTPGAWCRLADVRVNPDGTVDVVTPSPAFNPWHN